MNEVFQVTAKRLDQLELSHPHFINIDIQGGELEVIKGAGDTLKKTLGMEVEVELLAMYEVNLYSER